ncbi:MAG TPA: methyl-accepting chemotaxis protein, partial [Methanospirillum sp.]|uniref:methyl-accepting chemotaxis protein n=1 Tax=Methanospirillum sp. TaxID=45200 RepID=UPI002C86CD5F
IILICLIFYLVSSRLNQQLTQLFKGMGEIGKGNLEYRIQMDGDDEFARVSKTFDDMTVVINGVSNDIQDIADEAGNGNLSRRINTGEYRGDFLAMTSRINDLVDAIVKPLNEAMKLANSYASSDFTPRFNDLIQVKGEFLTFKDAMNQVGIQCSLAIRGVKTEIEALTSGMEETAASMEEIAGSVSIVADGSVNVSSYSNQSRDGVKQSLVALDELSKIVATIASKSEIASATAMKTVELSARGKTLANQADKNMSEIMKSVTATETMVNDISEQMEEIGKIVFLISRIADQTSLLALNAAIEAARAGEAGLGFAVVADEVKDLAQDSQDSTEDIAEIIGNLQKRITEVTEAMKKSTQEVYTGNEAVSETLVLFNQIVSEIDDIHQQMSDIAGGTEEQAAATQEITASVHELGTLIEKTSDEAAGSAASTEEVSGAVSQVNKVVNDGALAIQRISNEMNKFIV